MIASGDLNRFLERGRGMKWVLSGGRSTGASRRHCGAGRRDAAAGPSREPAGALPAEAGGDLLHARRAVGLAQRHQSFRQAAGPRRPETVVGAGQPRPQNHLRTGRGQDAFAARTRIAEKNLPFGGTWTIDIAPTGRQRGAVTEDGEIYNPIFRFMARFFFGYTATIEGYLRDLGHRFGELTKIEP